MHQISYAAPATIDDALASLAQFGERAAPFAGGTDLLVQMRERRRTNDVPIDLKPSPSWLGCRWTAGRSRSAPPFRAPRPDQPLERGASRDRRARQSPGVG